VRASLARLGVPGFRVFRWERDWHQPGLPFRDPADYPRVSVAAAGTHDTEPLSIWWEESSPDERRNVAELPTIRRIGTGADFTHGPYNPRVRDVLLEALYASRSELLLLPIQDVFGWRDRINEPATVNGDNWTFRLPWSVDRLDQIADAQERKQTLHHWAERHDRL
jgi:4-alpha-glucanotransferase